MLDRCVDNILEIEELNISWLPDAVERKIYSYVVATAFKAIYGGVAGLQGMELLGHHLELELLKGNVPRVPIEGIHAANLHAIVENLMQYEAMKNIWLPASMKKELFFNILLLIITVSQIVLGATQCDLLGHTIALAFTRAPTVSKVDPGRTSIDTAAIYEHVDAILASESNIWYIPDYFERNMLFSIHLVVLTIVEEVFVDFRVNVMGDEVRFYLRPGVLPNVREMSDIDDVKSHLRVMRDEKRALEARLAELDRVIEQEGGGGRAGVSPSSSASSPP
jgi:hypothetical protein